MPLQNFLDDLKTAVPKGDVGGFSQRTLLHGTPYVFSGREAEYYAFKRRLCDQLDILHTDIFIVGSAKLGFSPIKRTLFTADSDVDVAIVSQALFDRIFELVSTFQYALRSQSVTLGPRQAKGYHRFLCHLVMGWARPDLLPQHGACIDFKSSWFDFFTAISHGRSEVGNYAVSAGVFKSHAHLERYTIDSMLKVHQMLLVEAAT